MSYFQFLMHWVPECLSEYRSCGDVVTNLFLKSWTYIIDSHIDCDLVTIKELKICNRLKAAFKKILMVS